MATNKAPHGGSVIILSIMIAMLLMILPLPDVLRFMRPEWVLMTLIYWTMALPQRSGVGLAWVIGLFMDVLTGGALGILALAYSLVTYLVLQFYLQLRQYPTWQQALSVLPLVLVVHLIIVIMSSGVNAGWHIWLPAISSMVLWPVIYLLLRAARRTFHVS
ncbi:MAG: rod shape-determining protein MreD [Methylophagaceae bacterium]